MTKQATHSEILLIASLVLRINELNTGHILTIDIHQSGLRLMTFDCDNRIEGCESIYQFEDAYLPKLRFLRHRLEKLEQEALGERRECVA
jgi:hypothetical protein